jgi:hypothetical protein
MTTNLRCSACGVEKACNCKNAMYITAAEYVAMHDDPVNESVREAAERMGVGVMTVQRHRENSGVPNGTPETRPDKRGRAQPTRKPKRKNPTPSEPPPNQRGFFFDCTFDCAQVPEVANSSMISMVLAEGVGFEPTVPLRARRFSRPVP